MTNKKSVKINYSHDVIKEINDDLSLKINNLEDELNKLIDDKIELYLVNLYYWLEKSKNKVNSYSLYLHRDEKSMDYYFRFYWDKPEDIFVSQKTNSMTYEAASDYKNKILSKKTFNYMCSNILIKEIKIYPTDDILLKIAVFIYGEVKGNLWVNKKRLELLNDNLNESISDSDKKEDKKIKL